MSLFRQMGEKEQIMILPQQEGKIFTLFIFVFYKICHFFFSPFPPPSPVVPSSPTVLSTIFGMEQDQDILSLIIVFLLFIIKVTVQRVVELGWNYLFR